MAILTCPKCKELYDPGVDDELRDLADNVSLKVVCPKCGQWVRLPENQPIDAPDALANIADERKTESQPAATLEDPRDAAWGEAEDRPRRRRDRDKEADGDRDREFDRYRPWIDQAAEDYSDTPGGRGKPMDGLGLTSMIIGIFSCVVTLTGFCCVFMNLLGLAGGIAAVIMGFIARKRPTASGMALAGLITGFVAFGLSLLWIAFTVIRLAIQFS